MQIPECPICHTACREIVGKIYRERWERRKSKQRYFREEYPKVKRKKRRERERAAGGPIPPIKVRQRIAYWGDACWMCGGLNESIDHVKPLSKGGKNMAANIRPACFKCNRAKGDKHGEDVLPLIKRRPRKVELP